MIEEQFRKILGRDRRVLHLRSLNHLIMLMYLLDRRTDGR